MIRAALVALIYLLNPFQFSQIAGRKVGTKSVLLPPSHPAGEMQGAVSMSNS